MTDEGNILRVRIRVTEGQVECREREQLMWFRATSTQHLSQCLERRQLAGALELIVRVVSIDSERLRTIFLVDALNSTASVDRPVVTRNDYGKVTAKVDKLGLYCSEPERAGQVETGNLGVHHVRCV